MNKILVTILGCLFLAIGVAYADQHDKGDCGVKCEKYAEKKMKKLTKKLDLTDEQQKQVRGALDKKMEKKKLVHKEMHEKLDKIHQEHREAMNTILNDEQDKKYAAMVEKHKDKKERKKCCGEDECPYNK